MPKAPSTLTNVCDFVVVVIVAVMMVAVTIFSLVTLDALTLPLVLHKLGI